MKLVLGSDFSAMNDSVHAYGRRQLLLSVVLQLLLYLSGCVSQVIA